MKIESRAHKAATQHAHNRVSHPGGVKEGAFVIRRVKVEADIMDLQLGHESLDLGEREQQLT